MMGFNYIENFESKSLKDFKPGDTLYRVQRILEKRRRR